MSSVIVATGVSYISDLDRAKSYGAAIGGYAAVVVIQTIRAPKLIIPLAYDSGGVTTSTVTVPLITALGLGLAETIPGRSPLLDGFGLVAFASLFPIISVLSYAQLTEYLDRRRASNNDQPAKRVAGEET